jgi:hypothetical protein
VDQPLTPDQLPALETPCPACETRGGDMGGPYGREEWFRCWECGGAGFLPTPFGQRVLDLMRHHFRPLLQDATGE